ncbi:MAG TPA: hypothetical protein VKX25_16395 [Bryobacteraceae bacterium]|jgi:hypothetical protein|nr:hypothetical protein [Bryobacteraceae bacterium]
MVVAALIALITWSTMRGRHYRVTVCMAYAGRTSCRTVKAATEEAALRSATENACADISSGVTDTMRCQNSQPQSINWLARPK